MPEKAVIVAAESPKSEKKSKKDKKDKKEKKSKKLKKEKETTPKKKNSMIYCKWSRHNEFDQRN